MMHTEQHKTDPFQEKHPGKLRAERTASLSTYLSILPTVRAAQAQSAELQKLLCENPLLYKNNNPSTGVGKFSLPMLKK